MTSLGPYWAVLSVRFREATQYRAAALAGSATQIAFGFIIYLSLSAFVRSQPERSPMTAQQLLSYVWLGQAFFALLPWRVDKEVVDAVRSGGIAYEMVRPVDLYSWWFFRSLGSRTCGAILRCVPLLVVVGPVFALLRFDAYALHAPPSLFSAGAFAAALLVSVLLGTALTVLMEVTILWTLSVEGVKGVFPALVMFLSGTIVPLPMFPDWAQGVLSVLPFRGLMDVPFRAYSGALEPLGALRATVLSLVWTVIVVAAGRWIINRGLRRVVVNGG